MVVTSDNADKKRSAIDVSFICATRCRVPTPVISRTTSIWPLISRLAKSTASGFSASATSRIEGLTRGVPPIRSINRSMSSARRLSKLATQSPANGSAVEFMVSGFKAAAKSFHPMLLEPMPGKKGWRARKRPGPAVRALASALPAAAGLCYDGKLRDEPEAAGSGGSTAARLHLLRVSDHDKGGGIDVRRVGVGHQDQRRGGAFAAVAERRRADKRYHELFDVRLMQARHWHGLPVILTSTLDELDEPLRSKMEEAYLDGCREIGGLLLEDGQIREAWMYLRPVGDKAAVAAAPRNFRWRIITKRSSKLHCTKAWRRDWVFRPRWRITVSATRFHCSTARCRTARCAQRQEVVGLLVEHLHRDLLANLQSDIARQQGAPTTETTIRELVAERDWLFANDNYHIDTSHLSSVVRFAAILDDPASVRLALDLTEYGRRSSSQYQFRVKCRSRTSIRPPALFFQALLVKMSKKASANSANRLPSSRPARPGQCRPRFMSACWPGWAGTAKPWKLTRSYCRLEF